MAHAPCCLLDHSVQSIGGHRPWPMATGPWPLVEAGGALAVSSTRLDPIRLDSTRLDLAEAGGTEGCGVAM